MQKRIAAIHDLSCLGKCSLTVALPVICAMGAECVPLPTSLLSGHFAALPQVDVLDLTQQMQVISRQWKEGGITFDAIFSGYLSCARQAAFVEGFVREFESTYIFDPAMADRGKLYRGFDESHVQAMKKLCAICDVAIPNVTESCMMLDRPFAPMVSKDDVQSLAHGIVTLGAKAAVITGVSLEEGMVGIACCDGTAVQLFQHEKTPGHYNGTGDLFASVFTASYVQGASLFDAAKKAADFTATVIADTAQNPDHRPYGVDFERHLHLL